VINNLLVHFTTMSLRYNYQSF